VPCVGGGGGGPGLTAEIFDLIYLSCSHGVHLRVGVFWHFCLQRFSV